MSDGPGDDDGDPDRQDDQEGPPEPDRTSLSHRPVADGHEAGSMPSACLLHFHPVRDYASPVARVKWAPFAAT